MKYNNNTKLKKIIQLMVPLLFKMLFKVEFIELKLCTVKLNYFE